MSQDAIIEKIKKLLRMKRGGTAGEIENALAMAAELARKHGIDLASKSRGFRQRGCTGATRVAGTKTTARFF